MNQDNAAEKKTSPSIPLGFRYDTLGTDTDHDWLN